MDNFNPFSGFMAMNKMGMQMMQNMMSHMSQNKDAAQCKGMPDMSGIKAGMQENFRKHTQMALPAMQQQMNQMMAFMSSMNKMTFDMMQCMLDQQCMMMNQFFALAGGPQAAESAPEAAAEEKKPEDAEDGEK